MSSKKQGYLRTVETDSQPWTASDKIRLGQLALTGAAAVGAYVGGSFSVAAAATFVIVLMLVGGDVAWARVIAPRRVRARLHHEETARRESLRQALLAARPYVGEVATPFDSSSGRNLHSVINMFGNGRHDAPNDNVSRMSELSTPWALLQDSAKRVRSRLASLDANTSPEVLTMVSEDLGDFLDNAYRIVERAGQIISNDRTRTLEEYGAIRDAMNHAFRELKFILEPHHIRGRWTWDSLPDPVQRLLRAG